MPVPSQQVPGALNVQTAAPGALPPVKKPGATPGKTAPVPKINYAPDIMKEVMLLGAQTQNYRANLLIKAPDASFMTLVIPDSRFSEVEFPLTGEVSFDGEQFRIVLLLAKGQKAIATSFDGINLNAVTQDPAGKTESANPIYRTPLSALLPYVLRLTGAGETYNLGPADKVDGNACNIILAKGTQRGNYRVWVDISRKVVRKLEYMNPSTSRLITARFSGISSEENKGWFFSGVTVEGEDGKVMYEAEISGLQWNLEGGVAPGAGGSPAPKKGPSKRPAGPILPPAPPSPPRWAVNILRLFIFVIICGLVIQGYLLWRHKNGSKLSVPSSRAHTAAPATSFFAKEIMVVDVPDSTSTARALTSLGQAVESYTPEDFSRNLESIRTGSGQVMDARGVLYKPRIIVIGPNAYPIIKSQLTRLQLYIKEGGKVLMLNHSAQMAEQMPFKVKFYSFSIWEKNLNYIPRLNIWRTVSDKELESGSSFITPANIYLSINGKKPPQEVVAVRHGSTKVEGTVIGIIPEGKGEWILCQYRLIEAIEKGVGAAFARNILRDLLDYARM
jgi:hypothetical protein